jgi:hypothetical protein
VVCTNVKCHQSPVPDLASLAYCDFDRSPFPGTEDARLSLQALLVVAMPFYVTGNIW